MNRIEDQFPELTETGFDTQPPAHLLDSILGEIPEDFGAASSDDSDSDIPGGNAYLGQTQETEPARGAKVIWGRFSRSTQMLSAAAGLLLLGGAGWIALRLPGASEGVEVVAQMPAFVPPSEGDQGSARAANTPPGPNARAETAVKKAETFQQAEELQRRLEVNEGGSTSTTEQVASSESERQIRSQIGSRLESEKSRVPGSSASAPRENESDQLADQLKAVGYVSSDAPDPKAKSVLSPSRPTAGGTTAPTRQRRDVAAAEKKETVVSQVRFRSPATAGSEARPAEPPATPIPPPPPAQPMPEMDPRQSLPKPNSRTAAARPVEAVEESVVIASAEPPAGRLEEYERLWPDAANRELNEAADLADTDDLVFADDEMYLPRPTKPLVDPAQDPQSTFGLDVDTASYAALRAALRAGYLPDPSRVRVEEILNAFDYSDPAPLRGDFALTAHTGRYPASGLSSRQLVRFAIKGREVSATQRKPAILTFVVDTSGSMRQDGRLETVKQALGVLLDNLRADDRVALVRYSSQAELLMEATNDRAQLRSALARLTPSGSTFLQGGLQVGYSTAERAFRDGAVNRVILLSDGIANVGQTEALPILRSVAEWAARGVELTTVGVGMQHNDPLLEQLANRGDGNYAYVDGLDEARRVFSEQLTGTLETIASDARTQVTFDPDIVAGYRLLGYENRALPDHLFRNDAVDAGEIGAGHHVTVLYEIELRPNALRKRALRRRPAVTLDLRYRSRSTGNFEEQQLRLTVDELAQQQTSADFQLAALLAQFAEELQQPNPRASYLRALQLEVRQLAAVWSDNPQLIELEQLVATASRLARAG